MAVKTSELTREQVDFLIRECMDYSSRPMSELDPDGTYGISEEWWLTFKSEIELDQRCELCGMYWHGCECE